VNYLRPSNHIELDCKPRPFSQIPTRLALATQLAATVKGGWLRLVCRAVTVRVVWLLTFLHVWFASFPISLFWRLISTLYVLSKFH